MLNEKNSATVRSFQVRIAALMQSMAIEGLPRNYELVYEIITGANFELLRDFKRLGIYKSQQELDSLIKKYLPHHFAVGILEDHAGSIRDEMDTLLSILESEQASLANYGALVDRTLTTISAHTPGPNLEITQSINNLNAATLERQERAVTLSEQVAGQRESLGRTQNAVLAIEKQKFTDHLTGLGNRRMFNRDLAAIFKIDGVIPEFAVLVVDISNTECVADARTSSHRNPQRLALLIQDGLPPGLRLCRFDGFRFGLILRGTSGQAKQVAERLQFAVAHPSPSTEAAQSSFRLSVGICMHDAAADGFDIVSRAEKALLDAQRKGANSICFYDGSTTRVRSRNLFLYKTNST